MTATFDNVSFTSELVPYISSVSPSAGVVGTSVTVTGSDFGSTQGSSSITFGGILVTSIVSWSNSQIVLTVNSSLATGPVVVTVNGLQSNSNVIFTCFTPEISCLTPPAGPVGGSITIQGYNFGATQGSSTVQFNGTSASVGSWSDRTITVTVPNGATSGPVTVIEGSATSNSAQFNIIEPATISGISPSSGPVGTSVVITGTGFGPTQSDRVLAFYGDAATTITNWSDTSITAVAPSGTTSGNVSVTVAGITTQGPPFTVTGTATLTDSLGNPSTYSSAVIGSQWLTTDSQGSGCSTCTIRGVIHNTYDSRGNVLTTTDPNSNTTTNTYDSSNNLLSASTPLNGVLPPGSAHEIIRRFLRSRFVFPA